jgi:hypothetical protein
MDEKTKLLFKAYLALTESEKEEFEKQLREYKSKGIFERRTFSEAFNKSLGPIMGANCVVCGK